MKPLNTHGKPRDAPISRHKNPPCVASLTSCHVAQCSAVQCSCSVTSDCEFLLLPTLRYFSFFFFFFLVAAGGAAAKMDKHH